MVQRNQEIDVCDFSEGKSCSPSSLERKNRAGGIRTRGLLHPRQALYQAEPQPELIAEI
jgi:hypothetical protein